jgi:hypothetical protein
MTMSRLARIVLVVLAVASQGGCHDGCLSCACAEDADCVSGEVCDRENGLCVPPATPCDAHDDCEEEARCDFTAAECTTRAACRNADECVAGFLCDLSERLCVQSPCATDDDCVLEEAPRCDLDDGLCVAAEP